VAAAAGGAGVRVVDREPGGLDRVDVVDLGALEVRGAEGIDDDLDPVKLELVVALGRTAVEPEAVLEPGTAPALNGDAKDVDVLFLGHQLLDLRRGSLGHGHQREDSFLDFHLALILATGPASGLPRAGEFVTLVSGTVERFSPCFVAF
jgi:hypothetical protein